MSSLTLAHASAILDVALQTGREAKFAPLSVACSMPAVTWWRSSARTNPESCGSRSPSARAWGALGMGFGSRTLAGRVSRSQMFFTALAAASDGRFVPVTGGVLVRDAAGDVIGAVGISGDTSDNDEKCALAGIAAAGLKADPGVDPA